MKEVEYGGDHQSFALAQETNGCLNHKRFKASDFLLFVSNLQETTSFDFRHCQCTK